MCVNIQIIAGTYDKVLHGVVATVSGSSDIGFLDNFLFEAHNSAVRCLTLSPPSPSPTASEQQKIILASGGSDEKINLYHIASSPPTRRQNEKIHRIASFVDNPTSQNPSNRELGSLLHHSSGINALSFPSRSKLLSAADDNTIAIIRTRDWTVLSSIKSPIPKAHGRPSGDTAPLGGTPAGINDFAIHPSMKLMISVGKGENCMRLWNLVTGKKAGVLNFEKSLLRGIGEGKWGSGEGRKVEWNGTGEEYLVMFERGALLFGLDSKPKARIHPSPLTKLHQIRYVEVPGPPGTDRELIAVSTEDGRILLYLSSQSSGKDISDANSTFTIPTLDPIGELVMEGPKSRIKDFEILGASGRQDSARGLYVISASSDGAIHIFALDNEKLFANDTVVSSPAIRESKEEPATVTAMLSGTNVDGSEFIPTKQLGKLLGTYETGHRITCLRAFLMREPQETPPKVVSTSKDGKNEDTDSD